ncbi:sigma-54 interaction domain-containing protein [Salicibibacter halophilus]|nr:sigma-54-dependent Fis family transcriptional regulator [Salicibibacter halophilus]
MKGGFIVYKNKLKFGFEYDKLIEAIDQMYEGFLLSDLDGRIIYANKAVANTAGASLEEIVGKTPKEMEDDGSIIQQSTKVMSEAPITMIHKLRTGPEIFITSKPIYDESGSIICFTANYHNLKTLNYLNRLHDSTSNTINIYSESYRDKRIKGWIGNSNITNQLKDKVMKVANTEAMVLITGESGVGKEVVASNIQQLSPRKDKPYIQINCGAIPRELIEAELFGYEKGAFTGADATKKGFFEEANGGTVLLDEIGEMPLNLQVKLLRVIQTNKVTRVGGTKDISLNVRFIASTNKDLLASVKQGEFREDLYYRLNVIPINVPSLKERKDDIFPLCDYFLQKHNKKHEVEKKFAPETLQLFQEYHWPGNVRQLENMIERLVIITEEDVIAPPHIPSELKIKHNFSSLDNIKPLKDAREEAEMNMISMAIQKYGTIRKAARYLEVDHSTIVRKMKKYNINL